MSIFKNGRLKPIDCLYLSEIFQQNRLWPYDFNDYGIFRIQISSIKDVHRTELIARRNMKFNIANVVVEEKFFDMPIVDVFCSAPERARLLRDWLNETIGP